MNDAHRPRLNAIIVDDEPLAIERLTALIDEIGSLDIIGTAGNGLAALDLVDLLKPDLLLLDISMPEMDGLQVAQRTGSLEAAPAIIFITAHDNFAVEAFDTSAVDYLLKPVSRERLSRAIERARRVSANQHSTGAATKTSRSQEFWVPLRSELVRISAQDIDRVDAERDYMRLTVGSRSYLLHQTITVLEERLDPSLFIRVHRSTIVRKDRINRLGHDGAGAWHAELASGEQVRIGRTYLRQVKALASK